MEEIRAVRRSRRLRRLALASGWVVFLLWSITIGEKDPDLRYTRTVIAMSVTALIALAWTYCLVRDCRRVFRAVAKYGS